MRVSQAERASSLGQAIRVLGIAFERLNINIADQQIFVGLSDLVRRLVELKASTGTIATSAIIEYGSNNRKCGCQS